MGIKLLNLQMIPWCFPLLGSHLSCLHLQPEPPVGTIKLIRSDGLVKIYHRPIHVSELMLEYPKHLVCRSDSFYIGQKIPSLSEDDKLQLGHKYFLLPKHCFQSVLSFVTIASFAASSQSQTPSRIPSTAYRDSRNAFLKKAATCQPFDIQKSPSGCPRIRVSDEFISQLMEEARIKEDDVESSSNPKSKVCTTPQLQKDYEQLVVLRQWKPKLETIKEKEKRKLSSFGMKRRKKSQSQKIMTHIQRSDQQHHVTSTKPSLKAKMRIKLRKY
ncbi:DUF4228 domain-containing protein [Cephalotus follicularis]|uniref:DUF4228 domain-containing protein n=1 Tax=Cephalotus follicularis TaxID=3775 RepID=A0A1Q3CQQ7_CEPFO|nr:DUF4228 domain-containing protein [Cephalotus follicularis]